MSARFTRAVGALTLTVGLLTAGAALADEAATPAPPAPAATPLVVRSSHPVELQPEAPNTMLGIKLGVGLAVVGAGLWAWKRRGQAAAVRPRTLTISARKAVGVRSELLVVEIDGHSILLGVTPGSIQRLATLPDALGADSLMEEPDVDTEPGFSLPRAAMATPTPAPPSATTNARLFEREREREREREPESRPSNRLEVSTPRRAEIPPPRRVDSPPPPPPAAGRTETRARAITPVRKDTAQMERQIRGLLRAGRAS